VGALVAVVAPVRVFAQEQPETSVVTAHRNRAVSLQQQGRHAEAALVYWALFARTHLAHDLALAGFAEAAAGRWVQAEAALARVQTAAHDPWVVENRPLLTAQHALALRHVGRLVLEGGVAGATVSIEGTPHGSLSLPASVRLPVGIARVSVQAPGYRTFSRRVMVQPEVDTRVLVTLAPAGAPQPAEDDDEDDEPLNAPPRPARVTVAPAPRSGNGSLLAALGYVAGGFGLAGFLVALPASILARSDDDVRPMLYGSLLVGGIGILSGTILVGVANARRPDPALSRLAFGCGPSFGAPGLACTARW